MIQNTRGIDGLKSQVLVVEMSNEQTLGCERIWLDIDIGSCDTLQEARFSDVRVSADEEGSGVGINGGETTQMLSHLIEIDQGIFQSPADGCHSSQRGALKLLALEERLRIFEQANIVARHNLNQVFGCRQLSESDAKMVGIVEGIEKILVKRVDILQTREVVEDQGELLAEGFLCELDFSGIEIWIGLATSHLAQNVGFVLLIRLIWNPAL